MRELLGALRAALAVVAAIVLHPALPFIRCFNRDGERERQHVSLWMERGCQQN